MSRSWTVVHVAKPAATKQAVTPTDNSNTVMHLKHAHTHTEHDIGHKNRTHAQRSSDIIARAFKPPKSKPAAYKKAFLCDSSHGQAETEECEWAAHQAGVSNQKGYKT